MKRAHVLALALAAPASAQTLEWNNAAGGDWNIASNWNPQNVPDSGAEHPSIALAGEYAVTLGFSPTIGKLSITNPDATLSILGGATLTSGHAAMVNHGFILINGNKSTSNASLRTSLNTSLSGDGQIVLRLGSQDLNDASLLTPSGSLTQGAGHTIRGAGTLGALLINAGTVRADAPGEVLMLATNSKSNSGVMEATGGGILRVHGVTITQSGQGRLRAAGGNIHLADAVIDGGTLVTEGDSRVECVNAISILDGVVNEGNLWIHDGGFCRARSPFDNRGTIIINPEGGTANATLRIEYGANFESEGSILLRLGSDDLNDAVLETVNGDVTQGPDHLIHGAGVVRVDLINRGRVIADIPGARLSVGRLKKNEGLVASLAGCTLSLGGTPTVQEVNGVIKADGGLVKLNGASITGGTLTTAGDGVIESANGEQVLADLTLTGILNILADTAVYIQGDGIVNEDVITLNSDQKTADAMIRFDKPSTLSGTGSIVMKLGSADLNDAEIASKDVQFTHGEDHTIRGAGIITGQLVNEGSVIADTPGKTLQLSETAKTNLGLLAADGGILAIKSITVSQLDPGIIRADAGAVELHSATIDGGVLVQSGAGALRAASGTVILENVTLAEGRLLIDGDAEVRVEEALINNAEIVVNANKSPDPAVLRLWLHAPILGEGTVTLRSGPDDLNAAQFRLAPDDQIPSGITVRGRGLLDADGPMLLFGRLSPGEPGDPLGRIWLSGMPTLHASSVLDMEIAGPEEFDIINSGELSIAGTLHLSRLDDFLPEPGQRFTIIITASNSGRFDAVTGDAGPGLIWKAIYSEHKIEVIATCPADLSLDGALDLFDFLAFVNLFNAADPQADCDGDGEFTLFDFLCFVNAFSAGC
jgi:hypothetical protein